MKKLSILTAAALLSLGVGAAVTPSFAASIASCQDDVARGATGANEYTSMIATDSPAILAGLQQKGINATDVTDWGGCVKADVVRKDGHTAQEFFDPNTLHRLSVNGG